MGNIIETDEDILLPEGETEKVFESKEKIMLRGKEELNEGQIGTHINKRENVFEQEINDYIDPLKNHPGLV